MSEVCAVWTVVEHVEEREKGMEGREERTSGWVEADRQDSRERERGCVSEKEEERMKMREREREGGRGGKGGWTRRACSKNCV